MVTKEELNKHNYPTSEEMDSNLDILCDRLNALEKASGFTFLVTSGLRSDQQQSDLILQGKTAAFHSKHLTGQAADIYDKEKILQAWCLANFERLEGIGVWCEAFQYTHDWVHFQIVPPTSGHRFFIP